jgi:ribonuclease HI
MNNSTEIWLFTDGGARGNPGPAACAAVLTTDLGEIIATESKYLGTTTNNMAEYEGLLLGFELAKQHNVQNLKVHMDSELIVMQMNGAYRVKEPRLKEKWELAKQLKLHFPQLKIVHVRREKNKHADQLVNETLDAQS